MSTNQPNPLDKLQSVAAKALDNEGYCQELVNDPATVLSREGFHIPAGVKVVVHQNTQTEIHLVLPSSASPGGQLDVNETNIQTLAAAMQF